MADEERKVEARAEIEETKPAEGAGAGEAAPEAQDLPQFEGLNLVFGRYSTADVEVNDPGLRRYINLKGVAIPHTSGRHANQSFAKARVSIVERLINNLMRTEKYNGKKAKSYRIVEEAFHIIYKKTKKNPVQVLVEALENATPCEETTRLRFGGINVPKAVDVSPSRRLDTALRNICLGTVRASYKNRKSAAECLANELMLASAGDLQSFAVTKKDEIERIASSAR